MTHSAAAQGTPPRRTRAWRVVLLFLVVDAVVGVLALTLLPRIGPWSGPPTGIGPGMVATGGAQAALAGYPVLRGNHGLPVAVGRPWGTPCAPVSFDPAGTVPQGVRDRWAEVVAEAAAGGVPVLAPGGAPDGRPVHTVPLGANVGDRPELPDGRPQRLFWQFTTDVLAGGTSEGIRAMSTLVFLTPTGVGHADQRRVLRTLLARSFGLDGSTQPGSGLTEDLAASIDRFSPADLAALRAMAGCS